MTTRKFLRNDGQFAQVDAGSISISTTTTTAFLTYVTKSTTVDIALGVAGTFVDGPVVSQGSSGVWFATGTITLRDTANIVNFGAKLWDGTTVMASAVGDSAAATGYISVSLSGVIASPSGNIRISATDFNLGTGSMYFNASALSKDCTITAIRIG